MIKWSSGVAPESVNRAVWSQASEVARFTKAHGWIDPSERKLIERVTVEMPEADVLDIGIGGGRTFPLLAPRSRSYVAIDFIPALVEAALERFPAADIRSGDTRDLDFDDGQFDLVLFSSNGLDSVGHADRATALAEIRRVLRPGGVFLFSTHNFDGPGRADRPWGLPPMTVRQPRSSARALVRRASHGPRSLANFRALHGLGESGPGWAVDTSGAHDFGILVHYISRALLADELRVAGFGGAVEIWDDRLGVAADESATKRCWYFNVLVKSSVAEQSAR